MTLDLTNDLTLADGLERVTYTPVRGPSAFTLDALRRPLTKKEAAESYGEYAEIMASWHFQMAAVAGRACVPGDAITDEDGVAWTLLELDPLKMLGKWRAKGINLSLLLTETLAIQVYAETRNTIGARKWEWVDATTPAATIAAHVHVLGGDSTLEPAGRRELVPRVRITFAAPAAPFLFSGVYSFVRATGQRYVFRGYDAPRALQVLQTVNAEEVSG